MTRQMERRLHYAASRHIFPADEETKRRSNTKQKTQLNWLKLMAADWKMQKSSGCSVYSIILIQSLIKSIKFLLFEVIQMDWLGKLLQTALIEFNSFTPLCC